MTEFFHFFGYFPLYCVLKQLAFCFFHRFRHTPLFTDLAGAAALASFALADVTDFADPAQAQVTR